MIKNLLKISISGMSFLFFAAIPVFAHATVSPRQVGISAFQDFSVGVPSEKDSATTIVRLVLPQGLEFVTPIVKPGWSVEVKSGPLPSGMKAPVASDGDVSNSIPTEINWTGGSIPAGQKDFFTFSAQVPAEEGELDWKIYQSYADGSTVAWELGANDPQPKNEQGAPNFSTKGPYSRTMIINDLLPIVKDTETVKSSSQPTMPLVFVALALSAASIAMQLRKNK